MSRLALSLGAILFCGAATAFAAPGDQWILGIHHFDVSNDPQFSDGFIESLGTGYNGPQSSGNPAYTGNSYSHYGYAGDISRVYWELSGNSIGTNQPVPSTTELYTVEYFGTPQPNGRDDFQPIESHFHGIVGEGNHGIPPWQSTPSPLYDEHIPWIGQSNANHQWIKPDTNIPGEWRPTGPGPQAPDSADFNASGFGTYMWLTAGSWLYAKWDFGFDPHRAWSAIRLTQVTGPTEQNADYNDDGTIDAADYVAWRKSNIDGQNGYNAWVSSFGEVVNSAGAGSVTPTSGVPEPGIAVMIVFASFIGATLRRNR